MGLSNKTHHKVERWIERYARVGYGAKGIIYGTAGLLALMQAFDLTQGDTVGSQGALQRIAEQPSGRGMLLLLTMSLMGYVIWRFIQAILDPEHTGRGVADVFRRISYACSGFAYAGVAFSAIKILTVSTLSNSKTPQEWALEIMTQPFGRWFVGIASLVIFGVGCYYFYRAIRAEFRGRFNQHLMNDVSRNWATIAGRVGITARGFVYVMIGCYGLRAAWEFDPSIIKTTKDVIAVFDNNPADEWILAVLGVGFIGYGIHMVFQAVYRRIDPL